jgi:hypothetical protein
LPRRAASPTRRVDLAKPSVKVSDVVRCYFDPGRKGSVLRLDCGCSRRAVIDMGGHKLGVHSPA